jgi:hypothetical protein
MLRLSALDGRGPFLSSGGIAAARPNLDGHGFEIRSKKWDLGATGRSRLGSRPISCLDCLQPTACRPSPGAREGRSFGLCGDFFEFDE